MNRAVSQLIRCIKKNQFATYVDSIQNLELRVSRSTLYTPVTAIGGPENAEG